MNRKGEHVIVRRAAQIHQPVERPLHEIEWFAENFRHQFLDSFRSAIGRSKLAKNSWPRSFSESSATAALCREETRGAKLPAAR